MARIRTIKPEFFTSEQIVVCSANTRLLFVGMWCFADDQGIHPASISRIKMEVFPADNFTREQIESWIEELKKTGLIYEYEVDQTRYWKITGWEKHQRIDQPTYKFPNENGFVECSPNKRRTTAEHSTNTRRALDERSPSVHPRNGMERKGSNTDRSAGSIGRVHGFPPGFERFWSAYPRKVAKDAAAKAFAKLKPDDALLTVILAALEQHKAGEQWTRGFIPNPATWLNGRRWQDELAASEPVTAGAVPWTGAI